MAQLVFQSPPLSCSSYSDLTRASAKTFHFRSPEIEQTRLGILGSFKNPTVRLKAIMEYPGLAVETIDNKTAISRVRDDVSNHFKELRHRFLCFKKEKYLRNLEHYQRLAEAQAPKFLVISCADSRVCPSIILGFQPGEAFIVRNIANLVPPIENGPSETKAALEFAVNSLEVENILVVGHSCCGGIRALMSFEDEDNSTGFIRSWVGIAWAARLKAKASASNLNFDEQCSHCEKVLVELAHLSMDRRTCMRGKLSIHGGYYDFINCTFEKWTLDYEDSSVQALGACSLRDREFWA